MLAQFRQVPHATGPNYTLAYPNLARGLHCSWPCMTGKYPYRFLGRNSHGIDGRGTGRLVSGPAADRATPLWSSAS